ncbi:hypothetical protein THOD03_130164 [Vibrio harveyi]|nr:hypothetical protein THOD03_130164 [Vibrio harveyi]
MSIPNNESDTSFLMEGFDITLSNCELMLGPIMSSSEYTGWLMNRKKVEAITHREIDILIIVV